jgi:hypothetical protein
LIAARLNVLHSANRPADTLKAAGNNHDEEEHRE